MKLPGAEQAIITEDKLCQYLLNVEHRRGGSKARLLVAMGYSAGAWQELAAALRTYHLAAEVDHTTETEYGPRYEIVAPLPGMQGRGCVFRSVWPIDTGTDVPRLITMYPE